MDIEVIALVLVAAALHAGWNALIKIRDDRLIVMAVVTTCGSVASLAVVPFVPMPASESWPLLALSVILHTAYHLFLPAAYDRGDLGQVYPIARGVAPLLVALGAFIVAGEIVGGPALLGILCLTAGVMALVFEGGFNVVRNRTGALSALMTGALIAAFTVVDGLGARQAGSVLGFAVWVTLLDGILTLALVAMIRGRALLTVARRHAGGAMLGGAMQVGAYWIVVWALALAPMAMVSALRETSVLFAALFSTFLLKEGFGVWRFVSAALVTLGATIMAQARR